MKRFHLVIEYVGTRFSGWQKNGLINDVTGNNGGDVTTKLMMMRKKKIAVHDALNNFFAQFIEVGKFDLKGSSRTDSGVHALGQSAHIDVPEKWTAESLKGAANHFIRKNGFGDSLCVRDCVEKKAEDNFHCRKSATSRTYIYRIMCNVGKTNVSPFDKEWIWDVHHDLDVEAMREAANFMIGTHDFSSFRNKHCTAPSPIRTITTLTIEEDKNISFFMRERLIYSSPNAKFLNITVNAPSFLYRQVRNMVGGLYRVGSHKMTVEELKKIFEGKNRMLAPSAAPARGLYLMRVSYKDNLLGDENHDDDDDDGFMDDDDNKDDEEEK